MTTLVDIFPHPWPVQIFPARSVHVTVVICSSLGSLLSILPVVMSPAG